MLVATGRRPYSNDLGLEALGVARGDRGKIVVNDRLQTSVKNVYAIGDVTDIKQLAHFASAQGKAAAEIIAGHPAQTNWRAVPAATFTNPEIASVGLTEREAKAEGRKVKIGRFPFRAHGRNIADGEIAGLREARRRRRDRSGARRPHHRRQGERDHPRVRARDRRGPRTCTTWPRRSTRTRRVTEALGEAAEDAEGEAIHLMRQEAKAAAR